MGIVLVADPKLHVLGTHTYIHIFSISHTHIPICINTDELYRLSLRVPPLHLEER
jgi:hypothetical protein